MDSILKGLKDNLGVLILIAIVGGAYLFLRTSSDDVASEAELVALLGAGRPVLVEIFSNT